jgi:hypothetical protein
MPLLDEEVTQQLVIGASAFVRRLLPPPPRYALLRKTISQVTTITLCQRWYERVVAMESSRWFLDPAQDSGMPWPHECPALPKFASLDVAFDAFDKIMMEWYDVTAHWWNTFFGQKVNTNIYSVCTSVIHATQAAVMGTVDRYAHSFSKGHPRGGGDSRRFSNHGGYGYRSAGSMRSRGK